jgi:hypothetical protein
MPVEPQRGASGGGRGGNEGTGGRPRKRQAAASGEAMRNAQSAKCCGGCMHRIGNPGPDLWMLEELQSSARPVAEMRILRIAAKKRHNFLCCMPNRTKCILLVSVTRSAATRWSSQQGIECCPSIPASLSTCYPVYQSLLTACLPAEAPNIDFMHGYDTGCEDPVEAPAPKRSRLAGHGRSAENGAAVAGDSVATPAADARAWHVRGNEDFAQSGGTEAGGRDGGDGGGKTTVVWEPMVAHLVRDSGLVWGLRKILVCVKAG